MAIQTIVWTALPHGWDAQGRPRLSIVVAPRLRPQKESERRLGAPAYSDFHNWPKTLGGLALGLRIGGKVFPVERQGQTDAALWDALLGPDTPVTGFVFTDMSRVNLRSFSVRNVQGFVRQHYGRLATQSPTELPTLLPWSQAHPGLQDMLTDLGTRVERTNLGRQPLYTMAPGLDRFFGPAGEKNVEQQINRQVFGPEGRYPAPCVGIDGRMGKQGSNFTLRVLPADWQDPAQGGPYAPLMAQFRSAAEYDLYQANRFYRRRPATPAEQALRRPSFEGVAPAPEEPEYDFHRIIASYADTPALLRALGLVIDVVLPADNPIAAALRQEKEATGELGVQLLSWPGHDGQGDRCPQTAWQATAERFVTRSRTSDHADGLLALAEAHDRTLEANRKLRSDFDVFQLDVDGAALKSVNFGLTAQNLLARSFAPGSHGEVTYTTGDRQGLAALRSGGLGISRHGRAAQVATTAAATALKNKAIETSAAESERIVLFAEDVLRGYRVDVQPQDGAWHSLCARVGDYRLARTGQVLALAPDEGYVKGASTSGDGGDDHYLHEALFRWTGWSLVAERPGRTIAAVQEEGSGLQGEAVQSVDAVASQGNGLVARFRAAPGSLPRLRFGWSYRLRARVVDLAGNSLQPDDASLRKSKNEQATEAVSYLRLEPVDPPALVHAHRVSEGESLERLVLRSNAGVSPRDYLQTPDFAEVVKLDASADFDYQATCERHLVPPKASQLQCEQHGLFDEAIGSGDADRVKTAYAIAAREAGTLYDKLPGSQVELVTPASVDAAAQTKDVPPRLPDAQHPTGERLVGGQYVVHRQAQVITPYLPDPLAAGVAIHGASNADMQRIGITQPMELGPDALVVLGPNQQLVLLVRYAKAWPDSTGLRIVLAERDDPASLAEESCFEEPLGAQDLPQWDAAQRVLTLFVRKGHVARLRYASFVHPQRMQQLALPHWAASSGLQQVIALHALLGLHWMVTPNRPLVLVHATQQPICTPRIDKIQVHREAGDSFADLDAFVQLHGPSSGKVEVEAEWDEWIDDPSQPGPQRRTQVRAVLAEIALPENHDNTFYLAAQAQAQRPPAGNAGGGKGDRALGNRHELGDTRFRLVRYRLRATTRFREYLPPALYAQTELVTRAGPFALQRRALLGADTDPGAPVLFDVEGAQPQGVALLSSAAPDVPVVIYTVPTLGWQRDLAPGQAQRTSERLGGGLRVYLDRPWFSSGDGELLGVVLQPEGQRFGALAPELQPYVTQWGLDPMFDSALPKEASQARHFTAQVASASVELLELPGRQVLVVGHRVQWDAQRRLWFADIELDVGNSYMPFVRLSLVRWQPQSLDRLSVSRTVLTEFAQLLAHRRAVLRQGAAGAWDMALYGPVPAQGPMRLYNDSPHLNISLQPQPGSEIEGGRNRVELVLQERDAKLDSDLAWSDVAVLADGQALPPGQQPERVPGVVIVPPKLPLLRLPDLFAQPAQAPQVVAPTQVTRQSRLGEALRFDTSIELQRQPGAITDLDRFKDLFDLAVWRASFQLPADQGKAPRRLVIREFERYYTDRFVAETAGGRKLQRRVVEERLVYTEFFPL